MELEFERLTAEHSLGAFNCGKDDLNAYFRNQAYADQCIGLSTTTVVKLGGIIVGFFSSKSTEIEICVDESQNVSYERFWPAIEVTYLIVDKNYQYKGVGTEIIKRIVLEAISVTKWLGVKYLFLWSVPESLEFYVKLGFEKTDIVAASARIPMRFPIPEYNSVFGER